VPSSWQTNFVPVRGGGFSGFSELAMVVF